MKLNKSEIFKAAHKLAKSIVGVAKTYRQKLSEALCKIYASMKIQIERIEEVTSNINSYKLGDFKKVKIGGIRYNTPFGTWTFFKSRDGFVGYLKNHIGEIAQFGEYARKDWSDGRIISRDEVQVLKLIALDAVQKNITKWD